MDKGGTKILKIIDPPMLIKFESYCTTIEKLLNSDYDTYMRMVFAIYDMDDNGIITDDDLNKIIQLYGNAMTSSVFARDITLIFKHHIKKRGNSIEDDLKANELLKILYTNEQKA